MASAVVPEIWQWIRSLPKHWRGQAYSLQICKSPSTNQSLNIIISWHSETQSFNLCFSICAEFHDPISLWSSHYSRLKSANGSDVAAHFLQDIICGVLRYGPYSSKKSLFRLPNVQASEDSSMIFNLAALTLALMVSIYEAPSTLRRELIGAISVQLMRSDMVGAARELLLAMGSNMEEQWMRSLNLAVTNWIMETHRSDGSPALPSMAFSYAVSASRLWKVVLYCPVMAMAMEHPSHQAKDQKLQFSLNYQQLEAVIQFIHTVAFRGSWIDVTINVDNIRCDLTQLVSETLMARQGYGSDEKHFPSRISLQLTPLAQADILSLTVGRSTDNPAREVDTERGLDASLRAAPAAATIGITVSAHETVTRTLRPWKFEHSVRSNAATVSWFLHGGGGSSGAEGREVFSGEPPKLELLQPRSWFRNRYTNPSRPFTRGGGVIFAGDEYGEGVCWRLAPAAAGKTVEWEMKGRIWVTYLPNKRKTLHVETRRLEFRELLRLTIKE